MMKNVYTENKGHKAAKGLVRICAILGLVMVWILIDKGNVYGQDLMTQNQLSKQVLKQADTEQTPLLRKGDGSRGGDIPTEGDEDNDFTIKPNPVEGDLVFDFEFTVRTGIPVEIYDPLGKLVDQTTFQPGITTQKLDFSRLPRGMYIVRLNIDGKSQVRRVVRK